MRISDWSSDVCSSDLWDGRFGPVRVALGASWLRESNSLLAARLGPVFAAGGATSLVGDASFTLDMREDWQIAAAWRQMWTRPDARGLVARGALRPAASSFHLAKTHLLPHGEPRAPPS